MNQEVIDKILAQIDSEFEALGVMHVYNMSAKHGRPARHRRFAELIVQECINVLENERKDYTFTEWDSHEYCDRMAAMDDALDFGIDAINYHFKMKK